MLSPGSHTRTGRVCPGDGSKTGVQHVTFFQKCVSAIFVEKDMSRDQLLGVSFTMERAFDNDICSEHGI